MQALIPALEVDQGFRVADDDVVDESNENRVVAAVERFEKAALERGDRALQDRDTVLVDGVVDTRELVFDERREMLGQGRFVLGENVDRETSRLLEGVVAAGDLLNADKDERRIERHRTKCRDRDPELSPRLILSRDNSNAARESG